MKVAITYTKEFTDLKKEIDKLFIDLKIEVINVKGKDAYEKSYELGKIVLAKKADKGIVIDDNGSLPFMVIGKMSGSIVAQITDEHSAHMTSEHNGANVISIGADNASKQTIINIITKYINTPFAAGRHMVRTDMLDKMLCSIGGCK